MSERWDPGSLAGSPLFADLVALLRPGRFAAWPRLGDLGSLLPPGLASAAGRPLRFVRPPADDAAGARGYEARVYARGEIQTRPHNWHDVFNAYIWALFPASKVALNALHVAAPLRAGERRSRLADALTLIDECGVLIACADDGLRDRHAAHDWAGMFVERRSDWGRSIAAVIFGHGLYEQCLNPYLGLTGKACYVTVPSRWFLEPLAERYRRLDRAFAEALRKRGRALRTAELLPLPLLGVPGLWPANEGAGFYANQQYFRPKT